MSLFISNYGYPVVQSMSSNGYGPSEKTGQGALECLDSDRHMLRLTIRNGAQLGVSFTHLSL